VEASNTPNDTPPYPFTPSSTFAHSSFCVALLAIFGATGSAGDDADHAADVRLIRHLSVCHFLYTNAFKSIQSLR
jgi:hypothetical protein